MDARCAAGAGGAAPRGAVVVDGAAVVCAVPLRRAVVVRAVWGGAVAGGAVGGGVAVV
ncbi:hypothetical protein ACFQ10_22945 [Streptomyces indonesiensis]